MPHVGDTEKLLQALPRKTGFFSQSAACSAPGASTERGDDGGSAGAGMEQRLAVSPLSHVAGHRQASRHQGLHEQPGLSGLLQLLALPASFCCCCCCCCLFVLLPVVVMYVCVCEVCV